jgi:hypothetical protein
MSSLPATQLVLPEHAAIDNDISFAGGIDVARHEGISLPIL